MSRTHDKDIMKSGVKQVLDPTTILRGEKTIRRLRAAGVLADTEVGESHLWKALMSTPFGKAIGLVGVRKVSVRLAPLKVGQVCIYLLDAKKHTSTTVGFRLGEFLAVNQHMLAQIVTAYSWDKAEGETFAVVSQIGDNQVDMSPLEQAEFDFEHCPRVWHEDSQTREFDTEEYFSRLDRLNDQRRARGMPACAEGVTPSTYGI